METIYQLRAVSLQSGISYWTVPHGIPHLSFLKLVQISSSIFFLLLFTVNKTDCFNLTEYLGNWIKSKQNTFLFGFMVHLRADRKPTMPQGSFSPLDKQTQKRSKNRIMTDAVLFQEGTERELTLHVI